MNKMLNLISKKLSTALKVIGGVLVAGAFFAFGIFAGHKLLGDKDQKKANQLIRQEMQTRKSRKIVQITGEYFLSPSANENAIYEAMAIVSLLKGDNLAVIKEKFEVSQREMLTLQKDLENAKELLRDTKLEYKLQAKATAIKMMVADERVSLGALSTLLDETEELLKEAEPKYNENMNFNR